MAHAVRARFAYRVHVQGHAIAIGERAHDAAVRLRVSLAQACHEPAEALGAVVRIGIVLRLGGAGMAQGGIGRPCR